MPALPLYISVNYRTFEIKTLRTVVQRDEYDIVEFDANLRDLFTKDLFFIFEKMAAAVKLLHEKMRSRQQVSGRGDKDRGESSDNIDGPDVAKASTNTMDDIDMQNVPVGTS